MLRAILLFWIVFICVHACIVAWRLATWKERLTVFKKATYNLLIAAVAGAIITGIVLVF